MIRKYLICARNCIILKSNLDIKGRREQRLNTDMSRLRTNEGPEFGGGSHDDDVIRTMLQAKHASSGKPEFSPTHL
jgi:hypothetical protein